MNQIATSRDKESLRWLREGAGGAAIVLLIITAATGTLLASRYRPDGGWGTIAELPASARWSRRLVRRHEVALRLAIPLVAIWGALTIRAVWARTDAAIDAARRRAAGASVVAALFLCLVTAVSWRLVAFEQIALGAVTVGSDIKGLWFAAFSSDVRFVLIRGVEVSQTTIAVWVVVHLLAPLLALAAMAVAWREHQRAATAAVRPPPPGPPG